MHSSTSSIVGPEGPLTKLPKTFPTTIDEHLFCGLDLGIGSCGQALISTAPEKRTLRGFKDLPATISFLGIRAFDIPEAKEKTGVKLKNPERREKRLLRRVIARRAQRMKKIRRFLIDTHALPADHHFGSPEKGTMLHQPTPWELRVKALTENLSGWEWAVILMHYGKRRGFKSARKEDFKPKAASSKEGGILDSTRANHSALEKHRTLAVMFTEDPRFADSKRNKEGTYTSVVLRTDLVAEIKTVFEAQRNLGNPHATEALEEQYLIILNEQKPMQDPVKLLGNCPFLTHEKRTTPFAPSFELSRALQKLNTISLIPPGGAKHLLSEHILAHGGYAAFIASFGEKKSISWADLRKLWKIPATTAFQDIREGSSKPKKDKPPETPAQREKADFCKRSAKSGCSEGSFLLRNALGETAWENALAAGSKHLDQIAFSLAFYTMLEDPDNTSTILGSLATAGIPEELIHKIRENFHGENPTLTGFKDTCGTSSELCRRIIPHLTTGLTYDKAILAADFKGHTSTTVAFADIVNPIVKSVIREVMKQVVHLIDEAGALPGRIVVELGRELGKSVDERNEIKKGIKERTTHKDTHRKQVAAFQECSPNEVSDEDLTRYELYLQQGGECPYSGEKLPNPQHLYGADLEIDHILPRSRSHDNSFHNKVLVSAAQNQNKRNQTPYEWLSGTAADWAAFETRVASMRSLGKQTRRNLLNQTYAENETKFADRHLQDTRYISRVITTFLEALYEEAGHTPVREGGTRRVFTRPGAMTSMVRKAWGLEDLKKDMDGKRLGDKHHAVDALVLACLGNGDAQWIARLSKVYKTAELQRSGHLALRRLEAPWENFRHDVVTALGQITVSRQERCGAGGELHKETNYRRRLDPNGKEIALKRTSIIGKSTTGKPQASFTKAEDLEKIAGIHEEQSRWLRTALLAWIEKGSPLDLDNRPRVPRGCLIKKVFVQQKSMTLREQPQGHVTSGSMVRCDVFLDKKKAAKGTNVYHLVPIYYYQLNKKDPPLEAIAGGEWIRMDEKFQFQFSLWKNSRFEFDHKKNGFIDGTYDGVNRANGAVEYSRPDDSRCDKDEKGKDIKLRFSTKEDVLSFRKISVDRLGRKFSVKSEKRTWRGVVCT